ncbi:MAG: Lpg1974 family pore-forming outer membrane protein [Gammaproteobacteria bacterium]
MKYTRLITLLAASTMLATFSAHAYDKDGDGKEPHHKKHHHKAPLHRYTLTGGATYLAPAMNGLDYVDVITDAPASTYYYDAENINPNYNWGYFLAFGYMISSHYDIQASWQQFNSSQSESTSVPGSASTTMLTSSNTSIDVPAGVTDEAESEETLKTQSFDATLGQYHKLSSMLTARPFVGVKYAQVNSNTENEYTGTSIDLPIMESYDSKFTGVGPEIGLDAEYKIVKHFGVTGHIAAAFLVGDLKTSTDISGEGSSSDFDGEKNNRVVPALDAKLGLNWNSLYSHDKFGVGIEGGYQVAYYFDVVDQVQVSSDAGLTHNYSDVGIMGPYLNLSARF